jgi:hypothetical protein
MALVRPFPVRFSSLALCAIALAGCGSAGHVEVPRSTPIGRGPEHQPPAAKRPRTDLPCTHAERPRFGVHVEVFRTRQTVIVPAGIGVAPPRRGRPPYVRSGRCYYPLRTREPTGVLEVAHGSRLSVGDLFDLWGQPLRGLRWVWVDGRRWHGDPRAVPLRHHAQIVLSDDPDVPVHATYLFPPGL